MGAGRKKQAISLSQVPSVKELCDKLGFQQSSSRDTSAFTDTTHAFRKVYKTADGISGAELTDWKSTTTQRELMTMAHKFLDDNGNGEKFWSETKGRNEISELRYPKDKIM
jgi:hypothetical protein